VALPRSPASRRTPSHLTPSFPALTPSPPTSRNRSPNASPCASSRLSASPLLRLLLTSLLASSARQSSGPVAFIASACGGSLVGSPYRPSSAPDQDVDAYLLVGVDREVRVAGPRQFLRDLDRCPDLDQRRDVRRPRDVEVRPAAPAARP